MRISFLNKLYLTVILLCAIYSPLAEAQPETKADNPKPIRAVVQSDSPPTYFKDHATGKAAGFAVDVMNEIARRGGFSVTYQFEKNWGAIAPLLKNGKADVAPGQGITEDKKEIAAFTHPIGTFPVSIFARANDSTITDFKNVKTIGVTKGSSSSEILILRRSNRNLIITTYDSNAGGLMDLLSGRIDAFCTSATTLTQVAADAGLEDKIKIIGNPLSEVKRAIAVRKDAPELLNNLNKLIEKFSRTAEYKALYSKWYGKPKPFWTDRTVLIGISIIILLTIICMTLWRYRSLALLNRTLEQNINERKKAEEFILKAKEDWEETFNTITEAITIHDKDFNIIKSNKAAEELLGLSFINITKHKCYESYHGSDCPPQNCPSCEVLKTTKPSVTEVFEPHLSKHLEIKALPRLDRAGNLIGLIHVVRDITEHKRLQEQLRQSQKLEAIGQLAGGVAHDFNNIITAIIGYSHLTMMKLEKNNPLRANLEQILQASDRATILTQSLLAFSRKQIITPKPTNLNDIVSGLQKFLLRLIREDIEIKIDRVKDDLAIMADKGQLEQVIMNLVTNARDAMPKGGSIFIRTEQIQIHEDFIDSHGYGRIGKYALLIVSDTGVGIDATTREKIFEPFFTTKEQGKGTGLGLSMVYGIVSQHDGFIDVYSEVGKGTTFKIYIPILKETIEEERPPAESPLKGGSETILIAEDDSALRKMSAIILTNYGYSVIEAVDGEDAIAKYAAHRDSVKLVILDGIMPKKNGKEAYEEIRIITPGIKALFFSGYAEDILSKEGLLEPGINFILKPVTPSVLLKKVRELLDA